MKTIVAEIRGALRAGLIYLAITSSLTLPDVCAAVESPDGKTKKNRYMAWADKWLADSVLLKLTSLDLYSLRCGVVHQAIFGHAKLPYSRIVFTFSGTPLHNVEIFHGFATIADNSEFSKDGPFSREPLFLDAGMFCSEMINGVLRWYAENMEQPVVKANLEKLLQVRPEGFPPYVVNIPVIT